MNTRHSEFPARRWFWGPLSIGIVLVVIGLYFVIGGVYLLTLGGTVYYLLVGIGLVLTGAGLGFARGWSLWVYFIVLLGTLVWAVAEVGFQRFGLAPRLWLPTAVGIYLLMPWVAYRLDGHGGAWGLGAVVVAAIVICTVPWFVPRGIHGTMTARNFTPAATPLVGAGDWIYYGRTARGDRYSPLGQINTKNVANLKLAWQAHTGDTGTAQENNGGGGGSGKEFNFEDTPIAVNGTLYICTGHHWVEAFDGATGKMKWKFNPHDSEKADDYHSCRGVAYYAAPAGTATPCPKRIIAPTGDARLFALNAATGKLCPDFGQNGYVSLKQYMGTVAPGMEFVSSQPLVIGNRLITGGWIHDNIAEGEASGAVRAFDPVSGKLIWAWDLGRPPGQQVVHPADLAGSELTRGTPNAWGTYTADPELGLVYLPLGNATPDYYGGHRRSFDDEYSSSIVALDYETGAPRWHFQTTHHDLWDFDVPVGPSLVNLPGPNGTAIPALVQTTKRGQLFLLNRETGKPIAKVAEEKVPTDVLAGDRISPTQPYSVGMPSLTPPYLPESQLWGGTPIDQMLCHIQYKQAYYEGHFTPPQAKKTLVYPAYDGVIDWMGASIDPRNLVLVANTNYIPFMVTLIPREKAEKKGWVKPWTDRSKAPPKAKGGLAPMYGTPYVARIEPWMNPWWVPCNPPPWGELVAIDLVTRKIVWERPLGTTRDNGPWHIPFNIPMQTGVFNIGGNLVTGGGLIFIGATADDFIRAFDERTGKRLWQARLPAGGQATPMTYAVNGRQYVAIAAGGHGGLGTTSGDDLMVYALPGNASQNTGAASR